jgi:hypothetical protein
LQEKISFEKIYKKTKMITVKYCDFIVVFVGFKSYITKKQIDPKKIDRSDVIIFVL